MQLPKCEIKRHLKILSEIDSLKEIPMACIIKLVTVLIKSKTAINAGQGFVS